MGGQVFFLRVAGLLGAAGVGLGAFGAHGLRGRVDEGHLAVFETAVRYHLVHTVALAALALAAPGLWHGRWAPAAAWAWTAGIVVFSGSLYLLVLTGQRWLGAITPVGGVALIAGWLCLFLAAGRVASVP